MHFKGLLLEAFLDTTLRYSDGFKVIAVNYFFNILQPQSKWMVLLA